MQHEKEPVPQKRSVIFASRWPSDATIHKHRLSMQRQTECTGVLKMKLPTKTAYVREYYFQLEAPSG